MSARKLVGQELVTGIFLDLTQPVKPFFCKSCIYTKSNQKPIVKVREGDRATKFGGEVHTDLWGPAPVILKGGKHYYITFIDDKTCLTCFEKRTRHSRATKSTKPGINTQLSAKIKIFHSDRGGK